MIARIEAVLLTSSSYSCVRSARISAPYDTMFCIYIWRKQPLRSVGQRLRSAHNNGMDSSSPIGIDVPN